ncbi:MAG: Gfo/Idh/MocA family oxidoreductase, partial [Clostridia bacterium]|nr:Gfo/Idh/MocA family oxidoreductase [Clostridia bacterium]
MINACVVGLGHRGYMLVQTVLVNNDDVNIVAVCDLYEDRVQKAQELIKEKKGNDAKGYSDYKEALNHEGLDAVYVFTGWEYHTEVAIHAMEKGIAVASEVGCEYSLDNLHKLVETQERTGTPYMFMENCCYNKDELLATAMARKGMFGTIVHCAGAYGHVNRHYRFDNYLSRCCDNYPTHDLGPIAKLLDINRGNRIVSVSAFASKAAGLKEYIATCEDADEVMKNTEWKQGDIVTTIITCANGETI